MSNTYLLVWNPAKWTFQDWPQALADMAQQGFYIRQWSCMSKKPVPGDTVLLKKTGKGFPRSLRLYIPLDAVTLSDDCPICPFARYLRGE